MANPTGKRKPQARKPSAAAMAQIQYGKTALRTSFDASKYNPAGGTTAAGEGTAAVMDYYQGLPKKQRQAALIQLANTIQNRDLTNWSGDPGQIALFQELPTAAREAYSKARYGGAAGAGGGGAGGAAAGTEEPGMFTKGVSGKSGEFITEFGKSKYAAGEAETNTTKNKKKKKQGKKLVKRVVKKTNVKGKAVRKALKSPGITASDKKVYRKVAKQATPKLSARLRARDRRG